MYRIAAFTSLAFLAGAAAGQQTARPDPADPSARSPKPAYQSAFAGYRPYKEEELARWREANDEVARLAGHAGHVSQAGSAAKSAAKSPAHAGQGESK